MCYLPRAKLRDRPNIDSIRPNELLLAIGDDRATELHACRWIGRFAELLLQFRDLRIDLVGRVYDRCELRCRTSQR